MKYFCKTCGKTNLYEKLPLNYCGYCGVSFSLNVIKTQNMVESANQNNQSFEIKNYKIKPSFKLHTYQSQGSKMSDLLGVSNNAPQENYENDNFDVYKSSENKSNADILAEFQKEASLSRELHKI